MLRPILISSISFIILFTGCEESPTEVSTTNTDYKTFGGDYDDVGSAVVQTPDGGYLVVGTRYSGDGETLSDLYVIKTHANGETDTTKIFNDITENNEAQNLIGVESFDLISDVKMLDNGGYVVIGSKFDVTAGNYVIWLFELTANYTIGFSKTFTNNMDQAATGNAFGYSVNICDDNGYIITGKVFNTTSNTSYDIRVIKTDSNGVADSGFGDTAPKDGSATVNIGDTAVENDAGYYAIETDGGDYVVVGEMRSTNGNSQMFIAKLDNAGILSTDFGQDYGADGTVDGYNKDIGGSLDESAKFVQETSDGGFIMVGNSFSNGSGQSDIYVVKVNSAGIKVWDKYIGSNRNDFANAVQQTSDGGFVIVGNTFGDSSNIMVIKILPNTQGEIEWQYSMDGGYDDVGYHINQTSDGGFIVTGSTYSATKMNEVILIKLDASGNQEF